MSYPINDPKTNLLIHKKCGCKKYFSLQAFDGERRFEGIIIWWEHCPYHRKKHKVGNMKVELKNAQKKVTKLRDIIQKYPALIEELEKELEEKKPEIDTSIITQKSIHDYYE